MALSFGAQLEFARWFALDSGMNGNVVLAWCLQEQPPGSPATPGSNNWLNIQFTDSGPNAEYYRIARMGVRAAAKASVEWMAQNQGSILASRGKSAYDQALAIVNSGWASSHYGGIVSFYGVVQEVERGAPGLPKGGTVPTVTIRGATHAGIVHVSSRADPKDRSPKIRESGRKLSATGNTFIGHRYAMRGLLRRTIKLGR